MIQQPLTQLAPRQWLLALGLSMLPLGQCWASATPADYLPCAKAAAKSLEYCLKETGPTDEPSCWQESQARYQRCVDQVRNQYNAERAKQIESTIEKQADMQPSD